MSITSCRYTNDIQTVKTYIVSHIERSTSKLVHQGTRDWPLVPQGSAPLHLALPSDRATAQQTFISVEHGGKTVEREWKDVEKWWFWKTFDEMRQPLSIIRSQELESLESSASPSLFGEALRSASDALWHLNLLRQHGPAARGALPSLSLFGAVPWCRYGVAMVSLCGKLFHPVPLQLHQLHPGTSEPPNMELFTLQSSGRDAKEQKEFHSD